MADTDEDDGYNDDDLDALDNDALLQLEKRALQAVQPPTQLPVDLAQSTAYREDDYPDARQASRRRPGYPFDERVNPPSSDYGDLDEVLDETHGENSSSLARPGQWRAGDDQYVPGEASQREQWRRNRYGGGSITQVENEGQPVILTHRGPSSQLEQFGTEGPRETSGQTIESATRRPLHNDTVGLEDFAQLQVELEKLRLEKKQWESEKARLQNAVKAAQDQVLGKTGEIAIIRSNYAKQDKNYDGLINELKRQQREKDEQHKAELENARKEKEKLITHSRFLDHEINEKVWQTKQTKKSAKGKGVDGVSSPSKRHRSAPFGDGFDDEDIASSIYTKPAAKSKPLTPKNGSKRKRDVLQDSPAPLLQFDQNGAQATTTSAIPAPDPALKPAFDVTVKEQTRFEFLSRLLSHSRQRGERRTFEALATYYFPSKSEEALSTLFIDKLSPANINQEGQDFPAAVGLIVMHLWSRCLSEQYYSPLNSLLDLTQFVLINGSSNTAGRLMDDIVNLAQLTADVNVIPRFQMLNRKARLTGSFGNAEPFPKPSSEIDTQECLQVLLLTASLVGHVPHLLARFWHRMRLDFVSVVLRVCQTIDDVILMTKLLETCAREDNFSEIALQSPDGQTAEDHIIDRLSSMLIETPRPLEGEERYDPAQICSLRLRILLLIEKICDQKGCGRTFATHSHAIGRVVRIMNDELNAIYSSHSERIQAQRSEIVNRATRILFSITSRYANEINLQEKLRTQPGGVNKFLITLSRLAFSDAIHYEAQIDEDVFDCAHLMLEDFVTPEEADSLKRAFLKEE